MSPAEAPPGPMHLFRLDVTEVSVVRLAPGGEALEIELWTPDTGVRILRPGE